MTAKTAGRAQMLVLPKRTASVAICQNYRHSAGSQYDLGAGENAGAFGKGYDETYPDEVTRCRFSTIFSAS